jgi:hypothetical protein
MLNKLTEQEKEVIRKSLETALRLLEWDCETRLGVTPEEMQALLDSWPVIDDSLDDSPACLAINNSLNDLLHGLGISEKEANNSIGVSRGEMERVYLKWAKARGWKFTGVK